MKIGSLVRIRSSVHLLNNDDTSLWVGKIAVVLHVAPYSKHVFRICFLNGHKLSIHKSHLEVFCEGR